MSLDKLIFDCNLADMDHFHIKLYLEGLPKRSRLPIFRSKESFCLHFFKDFDRPLKSCLVRKKHRTNIPLYLYSDILERSPREFSRALDIFNSRTDGFEKVLDALVSVSDDELVRQEDYGQKLLLRSASLDSGRSWKSYLWLSEANPWVQRDAFDSTVSQHVFWTALYNCSARVYNELLPAVDWSQEQGLSSSSLALSIAKKYHSLARLALEGKSRSREVMDRAYRYVSDHVDTERDICLYRDILISTLGVAGGSVSSRFGESPSF